MKKITSILLIMSIFNLFGCKEKNENDSYWIFNENEHFKPKLNKGDFYKLSGYDFGWFVLEPLTKYIKNDEIEKGKSLSYAQKSLYYWWYLDAQVTNGGFVQFYYNGYEKYIPTIVKGLEHIGDKKMSNLVKKADKIYQKNKKLMKKAQKSDLFGSDLYDRLDELSILDDEYFDLNEKTMSLIEKYFRNHSNEICLDENGKEFDMYFSGLCKSYYKDNSIKDEFLIDKGVINGEFKSFYQNGELKEILQYEYGIKTGIVNEFYENKQLKHQVTKDKNSKVFKHQWYYENSNPKKIEYINIDDNERIGEYKEWFKNGQISEMGEYKSAYERIGEWIEFYKNGNKKSETIYRNGSYKLINYWNEKGEFTLKKGNGFREFYSKPIFEDDIPEFHHQEYKNYIPDGEWKEYKNNILQRQVTYKEDERNGIMKVYYNNGNLKEEILYEKGKELSKKEFPIFKNPIPVTNIVCEMKNEWLISRELEIADTYPLSLNQKELEKEFKVPLSVFEGYSQDIELSYTYFVTIDAKGNPTKLDFLVADNGFLTEQVEKSIQKMKFKPATKNNNNISSYLIIAYKIRLAKKTL